MNNFLPHSWEEEWFHTFLKCICLKVNVIARLEFEFAYYMSKVWRFNHYPTMTPTQYLKPFYWV